MPPPRAAGTLFARSPWSSWPAVLLLTVMLMLCAPALRARSATDILVMSNGDRLTCEIKRLERGVLYASLPYVDGTISIEWSKVARVESEHLFLVHTQGGTVYEGRLRAPETAALQPVKIEVLEVTGTPAIMNRNDVVAMNQTDVSFWRRLSGNVDLGSMYTRGNSTTQYNLGSDVYLRRERWSGEAHLSSVLSKSAETTTSTRNQYRFRAIRLIGENRWFYAGGAEFLQSSEQGIQLQTTVGGTVGRLIRDTNNARIGLSGGLAWQETQYRSSDLVQSPPNAIAAVASADFHIFKFKKTSLDVTASLLPVLTEAGRVRFYTNTSYSIQIISNLWWRMSFYGNWDNRPPATFSGSDYGASVTVSWSFN